eukprot:COSAG02_NODE_24194_length_695_cov_1.228188_1_plen_94_part_00
MGADKSFKDTGVYFPNPIRKQEHKRLRKKAWTKFKAGTRFPIPSGAKWEMYCTERTESINDIHEDEHTCRYLTALAMQDVTMSVMLKDSDMFT